MLQVSNRSFEYKRNAVKLAQHIRETQPFIPVYVLRNNGKWHVVPAWDEAQAFQILYTKH